MQIDWFTFVAQVLNFLILVLLLRRFLYRPVLRVIEEREEGIRSRVREAEEEREGARRAAAAAREREAEIESERKERLRAVETDVAAIRRELLEEAREEAAEARDNWGRTVERERDAFLDELRERTRRHLYDAVRRGLADLADASLERRAVDVLLSRLETMDEVDLEALRAAVRRTGESILVQSRFELPDSERERIAEAVRRLVGFDRAVRFETEPEVVWGVELRVGDYKVGWSAESYVTSLEENVAELLEAEVHLAPGGEGPLAEVAPEPAAVDDVENGSE